jgi:hypothetical protein
MTRTTAATTDFEVRQEHFTDAQLRASTNCGITAVFDADGECLQTSVLGWLFVDFVESAEGK